MIINNKSLMQFIITAIITLALYGCQANAETSNGANPSSNTNNSQWQCGINAVCGNVSGLNNATISIYTSTASPIYTMNTDVTNGTFIIPTLDAIPNKQYTVYIGTEYIGNNSTLCQVTGNPFIMGSTTTNNIQVQCGVTGYSMGGTISGIPSGNSANITGGNNDNNLNISSNGKFTFMIPVLNNYNYNVKAILDNSTNYCITTNGSGTVNNANVTNIQINCTQ